MIKYITRDHIDEVKYNHCIETSTQSRIYAYSWYLDIVADEWSVLVLNDYEAVMPLPRKKKYFIKYIYQPFFCQQLGVFSIGKSDGFTEQFIEKIPKQFVKVYLQFNSSNVISKTNAVSERVNYALSLQDTHQNIFRKFSKGRKHAIKQAIKNKLIVSDFSIDELIAVAKENYDFNNFSPNEYDLLKRLIEKLQVKKKVALLGIRDVKNNLIGGSVFLIDAHRIIYLFSAMTNEGKEKQVASFLLNHVIETYAESELVLDFEGSMIPGIASFFKSFGATVENYPCLQVNKLPKALQLW